MVHNPDEPERPSVEPEIIPPDRGGRQSHWRQSPSHASVFTETHGTQRIYVAPLGPGGIALLVLAIVGLAAVILIAFLGAVLIWIPVVAVLLVVGALLRLLRR